jgi:hypothetical protein
MKSIVSFIGALRLHVACASTLTFCSCAVQAMSFDAHVPPDRTGFGDATQGMRTSLPLTREPFAPCVAAPARVGPLVRDIGSNPCRSSRSSS